MSTLLFDLNNVAIRCLFSKDVIDYSDNSVDWEVWEYRVFNSIYSAIFQVKDVDEIVLAMDSAESWRKLYFSGYKEKRKEKREKIEIDWKEYFEKFENFANQLAYHFPFKLIRIRKAEADDVIGTLCLTYPNRKFHIISTDKDFIQLLSKNVTLYNPVKREQVDHPRPDNFLTETILMGQDKDNIPNVKTPLDWPVELRKPPFGQKGVDKVLTEGLDSFLNGVLDYKKKYTDKETGEINYYNGRVNIKERYNQNQILIDLTNIPNTIKKKVIEKYENYPLPDPSKIIKFFSDKQWPEFLDNIDSTEKKLMQLY